MRSCSSAPTRRRPDLVVTADPGSHRACLHERSSLAAVRADQTFRASRPADAGNTIRAAAADRIRDRAAGAAEFGADSGALQVHFSDIELVHLGAEIAVSDIGDVCAVDQVRVVLPAAAGGGPDVASIVGNARDELEQSAVRALQRKAVECIGFDVEDDLVDRTSTLGVAAVTVTASVIDRPMT